MLAAGFQNSMSLGPIENLLVVPISTFIVSFFIVSQFVDQKAVLIEVVNTFYAVLIKADKDEEAEHIRK